MQLGVKLKGEPLLLLPTRIEKQKLLSRLAEELNAKLQKLDSSRRRKLQFRQTVILWLDSAPRCRQIVRLQRGERRNKFLGGT